MRNQHVDKLCLMIYFLLNEKSFSHDLGNHDILVLSNVQFLLYLQQVDFLVVVFGNTKELKQGLGFVRTNQAERMALLSGCKA